MALSSDGNRYYRSGRAGGANRAAATHVDRSYSGRIGFQVHAPAKWIEYRNVKLKVIEQAVGIK